VLRDACANQYVVSSTLGRVLDPEELDRAEGPRGRILLDVPDAWLAAGDAVELVVPARVTCARCEGGGCDECGRSGALRLPVDEAARTLRFSLPATTARNVVRLVRPLGEDAGLEQLWVELRAAEQASSFCRRLPGDRAGFARASTFLTVALVLAAALALAAFLGLR